MRTLLIVGLALATSAVGLDAQTTTGTLPKGYDTTDGAYYSFTVGRYRQGRAQNIYGDWRGTSKLIQGFNMRRSNYTKSTNYARSWANLTIQMSTSNLQKITDRWASNLITPTMVFSASVSFPGTTGSPPSNPAPWGKFAAAKDMVFPFGSGGGQSVWVSNKNMDIAVDFQFAGGVLANNVAWTSTSARSYYTDGAPPYLSTGNTWAGGSSKSMGSATCKVPGGGATSPDLITWLFSDNTVTGAKQHRWEWYGYDYPANQPCFGVASFFNMAKPIALPGFDSCQALQIDLSKPFFLFPYVSDAVGDYVSEFYNWPYQTGSAGLKLYTQGAFLAAGKNYLTQAYNATIPTPPTSTKNFAARLYHPDKNRVYGYGPYDYGVTVLGLY